MQSTVAVLCTLEALHDRGVLVELSLLYSHVYPDDILPDDTPSTNVQVSAGESALIRNMRKIYFLNLPDFRVTHETVAKANSQTVGS